VATYYVNKSGSNANNGTTVDLAKLTIQAAIGIATNADIIVVGSGFYNELLSIGISVRLQADGVVVVDGTGLTNNLVTFSKAGSTYLYFEQYNYSGKWIFQNSEGERVISYTSSTNASYLVMDNCHVRGNVANTYGVYAYNSYASATGIHMTATQSVFANVPYAVYTYTGHTNILILKYCTVYNSQYGVYSGSNYVSDAYINWCIFDTCVNAMRCIGRISGGYSRLYSGENLFHTVTNFAVVHSTTYTSLATLQSAGYEAGGVEADPEFLDADNDIFYLMTEPSIKRNIGALPFGMATGSAIAESGDTTWRDSGSVADDSGWYNPDGNIDLNDEDEFELVSGTSGDIWSPVYDLGYVAVVKKAFADGVETWGTHMIDRTKTDVKPNYQTIEIRASYSSFYQSGDEIAWTEIKRGVETLSGIVGRYVQLRVTLKNDDVEA
jgi:hypothetical protein